MMSLCGECKPGFHLQSSPKKKEPTADSKLTVSKTQKRMERVGGGAREGWRVGSMLEKTPLLTLFSLGKK